MIIDVKESEYSDAQAITGTVDSTVIDHGHANAKIGDGTDLKLIASVNEAFTLGTGTYLEIELKDSPDNAVWTTKHKTQQFDADGLTPAGKRLTDIGLPSGMQRYSKLTYTSDGTITAGKLDAFTVRAVPSS